MLYSIKRTEAEQVGTSHIGDEAIVGVYQRAQEGNLSRMIGPSLHHSQVMVPSQSEQGAWYTYVVVQVALGIEHMV